MGAVFGPGSAGEASPDPDDFHYDRFDRSAASLYASLQRAAREALELPADLDTQELNAVIAHLAEGFDGVLRSARQTGLARLSPQYDLYNLQNPAPEQIYNGCARIYNDNQYLFDGKVNPLDQRYSEGGGHFQRDAQWFEKSLLVPGGNLIALTFGGKLIGFSLFFTNPETFPAFAQDIREAYEPQLGDKFAYTYLIAIDEKWRQLGLATSIFEQEREICKKAGCPAIVHEFFVAPVVNVNSLYWHYVTLREKFNGVDSGARVSHTVEQTGAGVPMDVTYAQFLIPTSSAFSVSVITPGQVRLVPVAPN